MHRLALTLILLGILASIAVASAYNGWNSFFNDGFGNDGPAVPEQAANGNLGTVTERDAANGNYKGKQTVRDWSSLLGRYAPWMADFEINASQAVRLSENLTSLLRQNHQRYTGAEYQRENRNAVPGSGSRQVSSNSPAASGSSQNMFGSNPGASSDGARSNPAQYPLLSASSDSSTSTSLTETASIPSSDMNTPENTPSIPNVPTVVDTIKEIAPVVVADNQQPSPETDTTNVPNPEPATLLLGGLGLVGLAAARRRKASR